MEEKNEMALMQSKMLSPAVIAMQSEFALACQTAENMNLQNNACAAFQAVCVVQQLRMALSDEVMNAVFMPLMNTTIGFRTDRDPNKPVKQKDGSYKAPTPYTVAVVRDCLIDALSIGLMATGNQMNIIAGRMYPTKEGYTALLKKIGCKYIISVGQDQQGKDAPFAEIPCKISYEWNGEKNGFTVIATVKKDGFSSADQLRGKAERRAKKSLYEYITGCDFGDADEDSSSPIATKQKTEVIEVPTDAPQQSFASVAAQVATQEGNWRQKAKEQATGSAPNPGF